jgi:hypothetical protein
MFTITSSPSIFIILIGLSAVCALCIAAGAPGQPKAPVGSAENPQAITSADLGPDIDPRKVTGKTYSAIPLFRTFRSFVSGSYAIGGVWVYAENDEQALYDTQVAYLYPEFYRPTWGEVFDSLARQMRCAWSWDPKNRQFKFERSKAEPFFGVTLPRGWRREDRGAYIWHAPADQNFGMDIYYYGHYTPSPDDADLLKKVRSYLALRNISNWPNAPTEAQMSTVKVGGADALYLKTDTPRPGGVWRQWSFVADGEAFLIVSAMPKAREAELGPVVDTMIASFKSQSPTTRPAPPAR